MDPFHERLARLALAAAAEYGFCLAGGYAVQTHGFVDRISKDVDLFTTMTAAADFPAAQAAVSAALQADGLDIEAEREGATFARLAVPGLGRNQHARTRRVLAGLPASPAGHRAGATPG